MPWVDPASCKGCGVCVDTCPIPGAVVVQGERAVINQDLCDGCGKCVEACPTGAMGPEQGLVVSAGSQQDRLVSSSLPPVQQSEVGQPVQVPLRQSSVRPLRPPEEGRDWTRVIGDILSGIIDRGVTPGAPRGGGGRQARIRRGRRGGRGRGR